MKAAKVYLIPSSLQDGNWITILLGCVQPTVSQCRKVPLTSLYGCGAEAPGLTGNQWVEYQAVPVTLLPGNCASLWGWGLGGV